jgi:GNAT superfamily N-acetyltransferase
VSEGAGRIEPLDERRDRSGFECGTPALDAYFHRQVGQDVRRRVASAYTLIIDDRIAGYYTLSSTSIASSELPGSVAKKLPRYPTIPATLLGRLAVDRMFRGRGFGVVLLANAIKRCLASEIATFAVVADAKDETAASFYERRGFVRFPSTPLRLFLPLATARKL